MSNTIQAQIRQIGPSTSESSMRQHTVLIDRPAAKEGADRGAMGGELLLAALGGCFNSNLLAAIRAREAPIENVRIDISGTLAGTPSRYVAIHLSVDADCEDRDLLRKLVLISERSCLVANTLKEAVALSFEVV